MIPLKVAHAETYNGITVDGDASDWNAVAKHRLSDNVGWGIVNEVAMVWDGDWVYIYFMSEDSNQASMTGSGLYYNGKYSIVTDLGRELPFQLTQGGDKIAISGVNGIESAMNTYAWGQPPYILEIAIPTSELPSNNGTISLCEYQGATLIENVADFQGGDDEPAASATLSCDGYYDDWERYPHKTIQYATAGSQSPVEDAQAAISIADGKIYIHAMTGMQQHIDEWGGEFTSAVTIMLNGSDKLQFAPRFGRLDANGNPDFDVQLSGLAPGRYEFDVFSLDAGNVGNGQVNDTYARYGKMYVTVSGGVQQMEMALDLNTLSNHLRPNAQGSDITSIEPQDVKTASVQLGRLGQEWVTTAGTDTAPWVLLGCCVPVALLGLWRGRKKGVQ